ncbi:hypothetical protein F5887DRAFT_1072756 [Amanita rubescens]|nr:hypothetical protein F5887DRAFT_1072756 [Amanita rubescens]
MRSFFITFLLFFISAVLSSPLYIEHGSYSSSLLRRGETGRVTGSHGASQAQTGSRVPWRRPKLDSHRPQTVADAIKHIDKGSVIGRGSMGIVYDLPIGFGTYEGRAVLKVMAIINSMPDKRKGRELIAGFVTKEARNLNQVKQLLAWGYQSEGDEIYYIVMKHMGERGDTLGLPMQVQESHLEGTKERYQKEHHIIHDDAKTDNLAFTLQCGTLIAHLVDWGAAKIEPGYELANAPKIERIGSPVMGFIREVPRCSIQ